MEPQNQSTAYIVVLTGEKPFKCQVCNKFFSENGSLKWHMPLHTEEKPYICKACNKLDRYTNNFIFILDFVISITYSRLIKLDLQLYSTVVPNLYNILPKRPTT